MPMTPTVAPRRRRNALGSLAALVSLVLLALLQSTAFVGHSAGSAAAAARSRWSSPHAQVAARGGNDDEYEYDPGTYSMKTLKVGQKLSGVVTRVAPFGCFVDIGAEVEGLVPISKIKDSRVENIEDEVSEGQGVTVWFVESPTDDKMVLSMTPNRVFPRGAKADLSLFTKYGDDDWLSGTVASVMPFGAFVSLPSAEGPPAQGLVHISQIKETRVDDVKDEVSVGDEVKVRVLTVDVEKNKMALSMKKPEKKADLSAFSALSDEQFIDGVVKTLTNFGAFVEVKAPTGDSVAQGLLHISQISENRVEDPGEELEVEQEVKVRVLSVDASTNKMSLSMRQKQPEGESV